jgi:hypothetical protein
MRGSCQDPICANERKDSKETDVDCGGVRCRPCEAGKSCLESKDCASLVCVDGVCAEATCDDQVKNGAELDVDCGASGCFGCHPGTACTEPSQCASNLCEEGRCKVACPAGKAECDDNLGEECETRISNDPTHCGSCDNRCELANATQSCVDGACQIAACEAPYHDCNGEPKDGCEVNLDRDPDNCGGCDFVCSRVHADAACTDGNCAITCDFGFGDCDRDATNGCEMALGDSIEHCGGCNRRCTAPDEQTPVCIDGQCGVAP